jgi:PHD-finger
MLQRVGRTGRARDGKVISILTKEDEAKHRQSKVKEKDIIRALKDPTKILQFASRVPLFPAHVPVPVLLEKELRSKDDPDFSYSQVGGNCGQRKRRRSGIVRIGTGRKKSRGLVESDKNWNLTEGEDALRWEWFGDIDSQCCVTDASSHHTFPLSLRRRFLKARTLSFSAQTPSDISRYPLGSTLAIARIMQETHGNMYDPRRVPVSKSFFRDEKDIQRIFPVEKPAAFSCSFTLLLDTKSRQNQVDKQKGTLLAAAANGCNSLSSVAPNKAYEHRTQGVSRGYGIENTNEGHHRGPSYGGNGRTMDREGREEREQNLASRSALPAGNAVRSSKPTENPPDVAVGAPGQQQMNRAPSGHNPYSKKTSAAKPQVAGPIPTVAMKDSTEGQQADEALPAVDDCPHTNGARIPQTGCGVASAHGIDEVAESYKFVLEDSIIQHPTETATANQELQQRITDQQTRCRSAARMKESDSGCDCGNKDVIESNDGFFLPTPPDSSSSEDDDSVNDSHEPSGSSDSTGGLLCNLHFQSVGASQCKGAPAKKGEGASVLDENQRGDGAVGLAANVARVVIENLPRDIEGESRKADQPHEFGEIDGSHDASQSLRLPTQSSSSCSSQEESDGGITESRDPRQLHADVDPCSKGTPPSPAPVLRSTYSDVGKHQQNCCELSNHQIDCNDHGSLDNQTPADSHSSSMGVDSELPNFRRGPKKSKRVDLFMSQADVLTDSSTTGDASTPALQLVDTPPDDLFDTPQPVAKERTGTHEVVNPDLDDTPINQSKETEGCVDTVCAVCLSPDSNPSDPIIFCDGNGCNLAVHMNCYSISPKVLDEPEDTPWLCDPCNFQHGMRAVNVDCLDDEQFIKCFSCHQSGGPLQKKSTKMWTHVHCGQWTPMMGEVGGGLVCSICSKGGAVLCGKAGCKIAVHPHCAITSIVRNSEAWTLLQVKCSPSEAPTGESGHDGNSLSLLFCPEDIEDARNISKSMMNAQKLLVIPPERFTGPVTRASLSRIETSTGCGARRLTKASAGVLANLPPPRGVREKSVVIDIDQEPSSDGEVRRERKRQQMYRRKLALRFIDDEAAVGSDEDSEGDGAEERELADLEAEENSRSSFINDSSPDQLDHANPGFEGSLSCDSDTLHARLDNERAKRDLFATPFLNRRMQRNSLSPCNAPDSERGLGRLHFVRSVLEHHRNGGDADEIEDFYNRLGEEMEDETP